MRNYVMLIANAVFYKPNLPNMLSRSFRREGCLSIRLFDSVLFLSLSSLSVISMAHASLSAYTANTIQGTPPALSFDGTTPATNLDGLLGFSMLDKDGQSVYINADQATPVEASKNNTFNSFTVESDLSKYYYDADGDTKHATTPVAGTITKKWTYIGSDGSTKTVSSSELANPLNACNAPYTLTIVASGIQVQSAYGDPAISSVYADASKTYTIDVADYKYCFAKPNQMIKTPLKTWISPLSPSTDNVIWNPNSSQTDVNKGGGYNSNYFDPNSGFKADSSPTFPTTGFPGAEFQLIMSKGQSSYTYSSNSGAATVDNLGNVTLKQKTSAPITITATPSIGDPVYYTFDPRAVWAEPKTTSSLVLIDNAKSQCSSLLAPEDLSNSPQKSQSKPSTPNFYTRTIGEGILGEWGQVNTTNYPNSKWQSGSYWTSKQVYPYQIIVGPSSGNVDGGRITVVNDKPASMFNVVCKG